MLEDIGIYHKINLIYETDSILKEITNKYFSRSKGKLQEPDYIASLALDFPRAFHHLLSSILKMCKFSVTGIFCHQKPIANFVNEIGSCEIGDLLLIYIFRDVKGIKHFNSLLLQAKISKTSRLNVNISDNQLNLYSKWPKFRYSRAGNKNGIERDIIPKIYMAGAKYLLIDPDNDIFRRNISNEYIYGTSIASTPLIINNPFSVELIDFINFKRGRTFEERPEGTGTDVWTSDEWSKMIWDMIDIVKDNNSRRKIL